MNLKNLFSGLILVVLVGCGPELSTEPGDTEQVESLESELTQARKQKLIGSWLLSPKGGYNSGDPVDMLTVTQRADGVLAYRAKIANGCIETGTIRGNATVLYVNPVSHCAPKSFFEGKMTYQLSQGATWLHVEFTQPWTSFSDFEKL